MSPANVPHRCRGVKSQSGVRLASRAQPGYSWPSAAAVRLATTTPSRTATGAGMRSQLAPAAAAATPLPARSRWRSARVLQPPARCARGPARSKERPARTPDAPRAAVVAVSRPALFSIVPPTHGPHRLSNVLRHRVFPVLSGEVFAEKAEKPAPGVFGFGSRVRHSQHAAD